MMLRLNQTVPGIPPQNFPRPYSMGALSSWVDPLCCDFNRSSMGAAPTTWEDYNKLSAWEQFTLGPDYPALYLPRLDSSGKEVPAGGVLDDISEAASDVASAVGGAATAAKYFAYGATAIVLYMLYKEAQTSEGRHHFGQQVGAAAKGTVKAAGTATKLLL